mmetsp:Transcript_71877/g.186629  ORF Transcript_71877/g.186629 Transcript_71877/m.186629 type:complete len:614 (-) Transcript_71877:109-1950(-)
MAGGSQWYEHDYEYCFVEMVILIVLVVLALIFETTWHKCTHETQNSYIYGDLQELIENASHSEPARRPCTNVTHLRLRKELVNRAGGEFMTLGFLAFVIFFSHNLGLLGWLVRRCPSSDEWHFPRTTGDWLTMAEMAHMKLFFGMVFYFVLIWRLVEGSIKKIQMWEQVRMRRAMSPRFNAATVLSVNAMDSDLGNHILWRRYFIQKMVRWQSKRPAPFRDLMQMLDIDTTSENVSENFHKILDRDFCFSEYLALSVESGVRDSIQVHVSTWCGVVLLFGSFALLHRFGRVSLMAVMPSFSGVLAIVLAVMRALVQKSLANIGKRVRTSHAEVVTASPGSSSPPTPREEPEAGGDNAQEEGGSNASKDKRWHRWLKEEHRREIVMFRFLQIVLFLNSYALAQVLLDFNEWALNPESSMLYTSLFALLFVFLAYHLPNSVPVFLGIMAMPPHVDDGNLSTFFAVLLHRRSEEMHDLMARVCGAAISRQGTPGEMPPDETEDFEAGSISFSMVRELWPADAAPIMQPTTSGPPLRSAGATASACSDACCESQQGLAANEGRMQLSVSERQGVEHLVPVAPVSRRVQEVVPPEPPPTVLRAGERTEEDRREPVYDI